MYFRNSLFCCLLFISSQAGAHPEHQNSVATSIGQVVYVPNYTQLHRSSKTKIDSVTTLSIHNVDNSNDIVVMSVVAYETNGEKIKEYLAEPITLKPFASTSFIGPYREGGDGTGANFVVRWIAQKPVVTPIVETLLLANTGNQGFSFSSRGRVIEEREADTK